MKKSILLLAGVVAMMATSCSGDASGDASGEAAEAEAAAAPITYHLDEANSSLWWQGTAGDGHTRAGNLTFSSGSATLKGTEIMGGGFVVDMTSMTIDDAELPDEAKGNLAGHLGSEELFNVENFPEVKVSLKNYKDGQLTFVLTVLGVDVEQTAAAKIETTENGASIVGDFTLDFSGYKIPFMTVAQEDGNTAAKSEISFKLNVAMTKE